MLRQGRAQIFSYRSLLFLLAAIIAVALGYTVAFQGGRLLYLVLGAALAGLGAMALVLPVEVLVACAILGGILADTWLVTGSIIFYARFAPAAVLAARAGLDLITRRQRGVPASAAFVVPGILFTVLAFFSALYSVDPVVTVERAVTMACVLIGFGIAIPQNTSTPARTESILSWAAAVLAIPLLGGTIILGPQQLGTMIDSGYVRLLGIFTSSNTQGLIGMLSFFALLACLQSRRSSTARAALGAALFGSIVVVVSSGSRASMVGLLLGSLLFLSLRGRVSTAAVGFVLLVLSIGVLLPFLDPAFGRVLNFSGDLDRVPLWTRAIEIGSAHPILGVGFAASDGIFRADTSYLESIGIFTRGSHNSYLRLFVDLGVTGLVFGLLIFGAVLARLLSAPTEIRGDGVVAALAAGVAGGLIDAFFEDWLFGFGSSPTQPTWLFLALLAWRLEVLIAARQAEVRQISPAGGVSDSVPLLPEVSR